jgi:hypothetical protein
MQRQETLGGNANANDGSAAGVGKFDLVCVRSQRFDHRPDLPSGQAILRHIFEQRDHGECANLFHWRLKDVAAREPGKIFSQPDDPRAPNAARARGPFHFEVYHVAAAMLVGDGGDGIAGPRSANQRRSKHFSVAGSDSQPRCEHTGLVTPGRVAPAQAIAPQLFKLHHRTCGVWNLHDLAQCYTEK